VTEYLGVTRQIPGLHRSPENKHKIQLKLLNIFMDTHGAHPDVAKSPKQDCDMSVLNHYQNDKQEQSIPLQLYWQEVYDV
jgi:hypothetical protein